MGELETVDNKFQLYVHNGLEDVINLIEIPIALYDKDDVYITQEDRVVFIGKRDMALIFYNQKNGVFCESKFKIK